MHFFRQFMLVVPPRDPNEDYYEKYCDIVATNII